ncbi:MAG: MmcQ/YjbR family DNA-binding protein [Clostridia bacterium]|nr:MmcQ/YjbR family DNA-binding protein [Clostridia bacterium]
MRQKLYDFIKEKYDSEPEYLWARFPDYAVFRHSDNNKWFAIVMTVAGGKLGLENKKQVEILNLKLSEPLFVDLLVRREGFLRGYHISRGNWISVLLDGTVPFDEIIPLLAESYAVTASKQKRQKLRPPKEWIIPANPKYYDIERAFDSETEIDWKQGAGIKTGDTVFMYVGAPVSAVLFKCKVIKTDIPFEYTDENLTISSLMRIKLEKRYATEEFTFDRLRKEFGIFAVRGPRGIPNSLSAALKDE